LIISAEELHDVVLERNNPALVINKILEILVVGNLHTKTEVEVVSLIDLKFRFEHVSPVLSSERILQPKNQKESLRFESIYK